MKNSNFDSLSDQECINFVLQGRKQYFRPVAERYWARVASVVKRYVNDAEVTRDLCQEAFFKAFTKLHLYDSSRSFFPWLVKIAINIALKYLQRTGKALKTISIDECECLENFLKSEDRSTDSEHLFEECLEHLSENYRILFALRHGMKLSYEEIAFVLDESEGSVKSGLFRIRQILKQALCEPAKSLDEKEEFEND